MRYSIIYPAGDDSLRLEVAKRQRRLPDKTGQDETSRVETRRILQSATAAVDASSHRCSQHTIKSSYAYALAKGESSAMRIPRFILVSLIDHHKTEIRSNVLVLGARIREDVVVCAPGNCNTLAINVVPHNNRRSRPAVSSGRWYWLNRIDTQKYLILSRVPWTYIEPV